MKKLYFLLFAMCVATLSFATTNPTNPELNSLETGKAKIESNVNLLNQIEQIIENEGLTFDEFTAKYPQMAASANLAPEMEDGIFDKSSDSPLGIPGFFWGFCLGWVGMLVVYLTMDEGEDRKEQVMNALYGCLAWAVIWIVLYVVWVGTWWSIV